MARTASSTAIVEPALARRSPAGSTREGGTKAGEVDARHAHAELSRLMRAFVNEHSGLEAPVMTLKDLVALGVHPALLDALDRFTYPSVFRREAPLDPALGAQAARLVVELWH